MRLIPALGLAGDETPPLLPPRFAADFFDVADLRLAAPLRPVAFFEEERLRVDLLGTEGSGWGDNCRERGARRRRDWINEL